MMTKPKPPDRSSRSAARRRGAAPASGEVRTTTSARRSMPRAARSGGKKLELEGPIHAAGSPLACTSRSTSAMVDSAVLAPSADSSTTRPAS